MNRLLYCLGLFLMSPLYATAEVAIYYGTQTSGFSRAGENPSQGTYACVAVLDLDATADSIEFAYFLIVTPSRRAGKAFAFFQISPSTLQKHSFTAANQVGVTFYTEGIHSSASDNLMILNGINVSVKTDSNAGTMRSLPGSLFGQSAFASYSSPTTGFFSIDSFSLGLLLPQTQVENTQKRSFVDARGDVENYLLAIGGYRDDGG